jgi:colicin import membrane protein
MTMSELPKDPQAAAAILAGLAEKDADETICRYPTCREPRQIATGTGRPSAYCGNPEHTAVTNHRARQQLKAIATGATPEAPSKRDTLAGITQVESLRQSVIGGMLQLQVTLERYVSMLTEIADPDISVAQIQAVQDQAAAKIAEALQNVSTERSLRLAAEAARQTALQNAQAEHEAAELAINQMEEAEARRIRQIEEAEQQLAQIQAEKESAIAQVQAEAQRQREEIETRAQEAIAQAQAQAQTAQAQAREAETRAHDAQTNARTQVETAERLVTEARATLERERAEVDRLREELASAHKRAETDRMEARANLERERAEVDRLREELASTRKRADQLGALADELRTQLVQLQLTTKSEKQ